MASIDVRIMTNKLSLDTRTLYSLSRTYQSKFSANHLPPFSLCSFHIALVSVSQTGHVHSHYTRSLLMLFPLSGMSNYKGTLSGILSKANFSTWALDPTSSHLLKELASEVIPSLSHHHFFHTLYWLITIVIQTCYNISH